MQIGFVGLGRMGAGMVGRLRAAGLDVVAFDTKESAREAATANGTRVVQSVAELIGELTPPRRIWLMLPSGASTQAVVTELAQLLSAGDVLVDGGNSDFREAKARQELLAPCGAEFVDVGVSGGQWGWRHGYGLMVGAAECAYAKLRPVLDALSADGGHVRVGECGAGHLVKALHNGVQYAIMEAYAEGFALLEAHPEVDSITAMQAWQQGSSIRSYLLEQMTAALVANPKLDGVSTQVPDSGMGRWTAEEAVRLGVPTPLMTMALHLRFASRSGSAAERLLRASRTQIGGQR